MFLMLRPRLCPIRSQKPEFLQAEFGLTIKICKSSNQKVKPVPNIKIIAYPVVETWRENIDGKYWFPAYSSSDDELVFGNGQAVKLKMRVRYTELQTRQKRRENY